MAKILFLSNHFVTLYSFRKELICELCREGHEVFLSLPRDDDNKLFGDMGCHILVTDIDRKGVNPKNDLKLIKQYRRIISQVNPDIIFSYTIKPNIYGSWVSNKYGYRQICNVTGTGATFLKTGMLSFIVTILYKLSMKRCYKVFFQNSGDKDFFVKHHMVKDNWEMLPGSGCNLKDHPYVEMPNGSEINFIFVGRIMEVKGIDEYLACARAITAKHTNTRFFVAGWIEEERYKKIIDEYEKEGYVEYIGYRKDINDWIAKCHCTVLPSHGGEGVPNVLLESAATGRPCIASEISGIVDAIDDGRTGLLFKAGDSLDLIKKTELFLMLNYEQMRDMGIEGRKKVENEFDRNIVIDKYISEVKNIKH